ncbi:hypothetical protein M758_4G137000 [Ceratodon purpureus]|nr:hypothetical protein M758_4G137000 [Ceratodon purpureus]
MQAPNLTITLLTTLEIMSASQGRPHNALRASITMYQCKASAFTDEKKPTLHQLHHSGLKARNSNPTILHSLHQGPHNTQGKSLKLPPQTKPPITRKMQSTDQNPTLSPFLHYLVSISSEHKRIGQD